LEILEDLKFSKRTDLFLKPQIGIFEKAYENSLVINKLHQYNLKFRAPGAIALSLAYAHRVEYVLYIGNIRIYDVLAGLALCEDLNVTISTNYIVVTQKRETLNIIKNILNRR